MKNMLIDIAKRSEKVFSDLMKEHLKKFNLNMTEYLVITSVDDGRTNVCDIANSLHIIKSSISMCCHCLELKGFIKSLRDSENRRKVNLTLTDKCNRLLEEGKEISDKFYNVIFDGITKEEFEIGKNMFDKVVYNLNSIEEGKIC